MGRLLCSIVGYCGSSISGLSYLLYLLTPADCGGSAITSDAYLGGGQISIIRNKAYRYLNRLCRQFQ